jgi:hypothetical protein
MSTDRKMVFLAVKLVMLEIIIAAVTTLIVDPSVSIEQRVKAQNLTGNMSDSISKMTGNTDIPLWVSVLAAAGAGSIGAAIVAFFANRWSQLRQEHVEMSKRKMDRLTPMLPLYNRLASFNQYVKSMWRGKAVKLIQACVRIQ